MLTNNFLSLPIADKLKIEGQISVSDSLKDILGKGEEILWQGAPRAEVRLKWDTSFEPLFALFATVFSIFWMYGASRAGGFFWIFGLLFFAVGLYGLVGVHFLKAFVRRQQHYTLTNQRALIGASLFGRKSLESHPITPATDIVLEEAGATGDVYFARREARAMNGMGQIIRIGFEQIDNPRHVLSLMRQVQEYHR